MLRIASDSRRRTIVGNTGCDYDGDGNTNDVPNAPLNLQLGSLDRSSYMTGIFKVSDFPEPRSGRTISPKIELAQRMRR